VSVPFLPHEANTPLVVNADTVLPFAIAFQGVEPVASRHLQIRQSFGRVQHQQFSARRLSNIREPSDIFVIEQFLRVDAFEGLNHLARGYNALN
jgi:hypothetical protein